MKHQLQFKLTRPAKASGGDRYECGSKEGEDLMVIYIPQAISREAGQVKKAITITIE